MEVVLKVAGIAIITSIACLIVKPVRSDFAIFISIAGGLIILLYLLSYLTGVVNIFNNIFSISGINGSLYSVIFKIIAIGYLAEFTAGICNDTGNTSLGDKVLLGGKIIILVMSFPIINGILDIIMELLP